MTDELKPCPFCGEQPIIKKVVFSNGYYVTCSNPKCLVVPVTRFEYTRSKAVAAWNYREGGQEWVNR